MYIMKSLQLKRSTMENEIFIQHLENILARIKSLAWSKAKEYAPGDDRYHNFNEVARKLAAIGVETNDNILLAIMGLKFKHTVSIDDIVKQVLTNKNDHSQAILDEKFGDELLYLILAYGWLSYTTMGDK